MGPSWSHTQSQPTWFGSLYRCFKNPHTACLMLTFGIFTAIGYKVTAIGYKSD
jgi:hypothetical protein